jgi:hypothetical protein
MIHARSIEKTDARLNRLGRIGLTHTRTIDSKWSPQSAHGVIVESEASLSPISDFVPDPRSFTFA